MNNYQFCAHWVVDQAAGRNVAALDYGCGAGEVVRELLGRGVDAYGCDVFYEGGDASALVDKAIPAGRIRRMEGGRVPFADATFDFVVNNQVMEHVEDIDAALSEIRRVLKPGGMVLSLFPDRGVWREGHCGIPFLHRFAKGSAPRVYYAAIWRALGLGYFKGDKDVMTWSRDFCTWLDRWTWYRTRAEIDAAFGRHFEACQDIGPFWTHQRFLGRPRLARVLPAPAQRFLGRKFGGVALVAAKAGG